MISVTPAPGTFPLSHYVLSQVLLNGPGVFPWLADSIVLENSNKKAWQKSIRQRHEPVAQLLTAEVKACGQSYTKWTGASLGWENCPESSWQGTRVRHWHLHGTRGGECGRQSRSRTQEREKRPRRNELLNNFRVSGKNQIPAGSKPVPPAPRRPASGSEVPAQNWLHQINLKPRTETMS